MCAAASSCFARPVFSSTVLLGLSWMMIVSIGFMCAGPTG